MWSAALPTLLDPEHLLAVGDLRNIGNANLYFFSWGSLITSLMLATKFYQETMVKHERMGMHWVCLSTASFVVMSSAIREWQDQDCADNGSDYCNRTTLALIIGVISGGTAFAMFILRNEMLEKIGSFTLLAAWCFGAAYVTFDKGPGASAGTLYFSTWANLMLSLNMAATFLKEMFPIVPGGNEGEAEGDTDAKGATDEPKLDADEHEAEETA
jgi:hypothetical protein